MESHDHDNVYTNPTHYIVWTCSSKFASSEALNEPFGGLPWPPKSYTCSFCRRDFRSAQALGGHMNVHRRDRARINRCPPPRLQEKDDNNGGGSRGSCNKKRHKKTDRRSSLKEEGDIDLELRLGVSPAGK